MTYHPFDDDNYNNNDKKENPFYGDDADRERKCEEMIY